MKPKLIIVQTIAPSYRKPFFDFLKEKLGSNFTLYAGFDGFAKTLYSCEEIKFAKTGNYYLFNKRLSFQTRLFRQALKKENVVVLELNPRILSNWMILAGRRFVGAKTVLWGHAWSRNKRDSKTERVRNLMRSLADGIIVYTETQRKELQEKMPEKVIKAAPNSLFLSKNIKGERCKNPQNLICVGRLIKEKKPYLLLKAFTQILPIIPKKAKLIFIGEGPEIEKLEAHIRKFNLSSRVYILGKITDYERLQLLYAEALFSVSPGYVGLSIIQSLAFGVPMLFADNESHAPEIEAATQCNSITFASDNLLELEQAILSIYEDKNLWIQRRPEISNYCRSHYSIERMAEPFLNLTA